jgi:hypothetical protein
LFVVHVVGYGGVSVVVVIKRQHERVIRRMKGAFQITTKRMNSGEYYNRKDVYDNMWDFMRDIKQVESDIYNSMVDLTTTHFEEPEKPIIYPMIWSHVKKYANEEVKKKLTIAIETWFTKQSKTV